MIKEDILKKIEEESSKVDKSIRLIEKERQNLKQANKNKRLLESLLKNIKIVEEYDIMYELNNDHFKTQRSIAYKHGLNAKTVSVMYYRIKRELKNA